MSDEEQNVVENQTEAVQTEENEAIIPKEPEIDKETATEKEPATIEDEGHILTMVDVLEEEQKLEEDANAVLGGSDEKNCTYSKGYVDRQALYACMTCCPESRCDESKRAGVCLACSYHCHEGHELVELYTKRRFRCDCGNSKFSDHKCTLEPNKDHVNQHNIYNHNFSGLYCTCKRPYPDPEDMVPDDMIQCIICEDWFHSRHLSGSMSADQLPYAEMTCGTCVQQNSFLLDYVQQNKQLLDNKDSVSSQNNTTLEDSVVNVCDISTKESDSGEKKEKDCVRPFREVPQDEPVNYFALWWQEGWRQKLCRCEDCAILYAEHNVDYLPDINDTVHAYEQRGRGVHETNSYEQGLQALSSMERVAQLEAIQRYNYMKDELKDYLQTFAQAGRIVTEDDIKDFFSRMNAKRPRLEIPYSCH